MQDFLVFVSAIMQVDVSQLSGNTKYKEFKKWDSLMHMRLVMEVEDKYGVEIPIDEVPTIVTLKDLYRYTLPT
ncbi:acyl carrier protein [Succiniclasticum ruminis]|uniref:Acyl carrier protein n=1 Tax=Succiniclasticum ruminis TaxID=40841 RepID=A0A1G6HRZ2_9FIRM|nr:acyl carrier protein [Succiniclasticum ruminis]SDB97000.1 acyl carrier protein [Succiniclasticum ruminis]